MYDHSLGPVHTSLVKHILEVNEYNDSISCSFSLLNILTACLLVVFLKQPWNSGFTWLIWKSINLGFSEKLKGCSSWIINFTKPSLQDSKLYFQFTTLPLVPICNLLCHKSVVVVSLLCVCS